MTENSKLNTENEKVYGIVYKNLRTAKGFSQKEAAGQEISATHLSNFENGRTTITLVHFFNLLQNINVSMFEFQNSLNLYMEKKDLLLFNMDLSKAIIEKNTSKLHKIIQKLESQIDSLKDESISKKLYLDYIRAKCSLSYLDTNSFINNEEISVLENYLFKIKEWGQYDIALLGQCAKFIDPIHLMRLTENMLSPIQESTEIPYVKQAIIQTVLNIVEVFINSRIYNPAKILIKYLEDCEIHDYYMFEKITLIYMKASLNYQIGDMQSIEIIKKCQNILEFCDCYKTANWISDEIENLRNKN